MKKYLVLLVILGISNLLFSQVDLETVWAKESGEQINFAKFSGDGNFIYCAIGNTIKKMDAKTGDFVSMFDNKNVIAISDMAISNDGKIIMTDAASQGLNIWDAQNEKVVKYIPYEKTSGKDGVLAADLSGDGRFIVAWVTEYIDFNKINGYLILYDLLSNTEIKRINYAQGTIRRIKISHDGKFFATGSYYQDSFTKKFGNLFILWDTETLTPIDTLENKEDDDNDPGYRLIKFSRDDKYLGVITQNVNGPFIYNLVTKKLIKTTEGTACYSIEFLPDTLNCLIQRNSLEMFDINSLKLIRSFSTEIYGGRIIESNRSVDGYTNVFGLGGKCYRCISLSRAKITNIDDFQNIFKKPDVLVENRKVIIVLNDFSKNEMTITISNMIGQTMYNKSFENLITQNRFELGAILPSGLYICKVVAGNKEYTQKFEIVR